MTHTDAEMQVNVINLCHFTELESFLCWLSCNYIFAREPTYALIVSQAFQQNKTKATHEHTSFWDFVATLSQNYIYSSVKVGLKKVIFITLGSYRPPLKSDNDFFGN